MTSGDERPVLVTGAFGNVGRYAVRRLVDEGRRVVATDLRTPVAERASAEWGPRGVVDIEWIDLTDEASVADLVARRRPSAVIHLAAVIPPLAYSRPKVAEAVNVEGTRHLVGAVESLGEHCRFVLVSSMAVYGSRNPYTMGELTPTTELRPCEVYGATKVAAEVIVESSSLEWTVLRLGAVIFPELELGIDPESSFLQAVLPVDGRVHAVDVRDVARALVASTTADCAGEVLLIGGDESYRLTQAELSRDLMRAVGLRGALPPGTPGDPANDDGWFIVGWMDTARSQEVLGFQSHSWSETLREISRHVGRKRYVLPLMVPMARIALTLGSPTRGRRSKYASPWPAVAERWGPGAVSRDL